MRRVVFGTAHLYGLVADGPSGQLLDAAWRVGYRAFDTAPAYGAGRTEAALGTFLAGRDVGLVATKTGLEPSALPSGARVAAVAVLDRVLPEAVTRRLRVATRSTSVTDGPVRSAVFGHFSVPEVRTSVERSLRRLGRVDRLVLHEVLPQEVTPELVALLEALLAAGDVGEVGVATQNRHTAAALAAGGPVLTAAHVSAGPVDDVVDLPDHVTTRVGHGLLGVGAEQLRRLDADLTADADLRERWTAATGGTAFAGPGGLAAALLGRDPGLGLTDVIVATSRVGQLAGTLAAAAGADPLPDDAGAVLAQLVSAARA